MTIVAFAMLIIIPIFGRFARDGGDVQGFGIHRGKAIYATGTGFNTTRVVRELPTDVATFKRISNHPNATESPIQYAADVNNVFMGYNNFAIRLEAVDPKSFQIMTTDGKYARDKSNVYFLGVRLPEADSTSFEVLDPPYARDKSQIYAGGFRMKVSHPDKFEVIRKGNAKPVWTLRNGGPIQTKNPVITGWARDGEYYYYGTTKVRVSGGNLEFISYNLAKDHNSVFRFDGGRITVVQGVDAATFTPDMLPDIHAPGSGDRYREVGSDSELLSIVVF